MSSANSDSFTPSFPTGMPFISFSCLITVGRISNTMLNRSNESGQPCLVPDLSGKAFSFCPLSMMLVAMQAGAATVENSMEFPQKTKNGTVF